VLQQENYARFSLISAVSASRGSNCTNRSKSRNEALQC